MRIGVVGSCQVTGLAACMARLVPGATVDSWHIGAGPDLTAEAILPQLQQRDLVISQLAPESGQFALATLEQLSGGQAVFVPTLVFAGFHPDVTLLSQADGQWLGGPLGALHSAVVVAAFRLGLPASRVPALFNTLVYEAAGYFDLYEQGRGILVKSFAAYGYDLADAFDRWRAEGAFMYTDNHPRIRVLDTLARRVLERAHVPMAEPGGLAHDHLAASVIWPIHPFLARRHGIDGSTAYILPEVFGDRIVPIPAYVQRCYDLYAATPGIRYEQSLRAETTTAALRSLLG